MKRKYVKPTVESEGALEQTSLQCNVTYRAWDLYCEWGGNFALGVTWCTVDVSKGGNFNDEACVQEPNLSYNCLVVLS